MMCGWGVKRRLWRASDGQREERIEGGDQRRTIRFGRAGMGGCTGAGPGNAAGCTRPETLLLLWSNRIGPPTMGGFAGSEETALVDNANTRIEPRTVRVWKFAVECIVRRKFRDSVCSVGIIWKL